MAAPLGGEAHQTSRTWRIRVDWRGNTQDRTRRWTLPLAVYASWVISWVGISYRRLADSSSSFTAPPATWCAWWREHRPVNARTLSLTIPPSLLLRADQVID